MIQVNKYKTDAIYVYANGVDLTASLSKRVGIETGISTTDSQLDVDGTRKNVFAMFKKDLTNFYIRISTSI